MNKYIYIYIYIYTPNLVQFNNVLASANPPVPDSWEVKAVRDLSCQT